jgi:hypoxanthine phosphoribosyltransferase
MGRGKTGVTQRSEMKVAQSENRTMRKDRPRTESDSPERGHPQPRQLRPPQYAAAGDSRAPRNDGRFLTSSSGTGSRAVPARWRKEVERVLISEAQIARRVQELSDEITRDFAGRELVVVSLLNGTVMFLADLIRQLSLPLRLDFIGVSSYGLATKSSELVFTKELRLDVRDRDVLLVDDILDTGRTLHQVLARLRPLKPRRVKVCVLLDKASRRVEKVRADYVGFEIPDLFVVGYGLDFAERYRNLPFVGVLHPQIYQERALVPQPSNGSP